LNKISILFITIIAFILITPVLAIDFPSEQAPSVTINFAGNLSDKGGPYWQPPNETTQLTGIWSNGYYTTQSKQHEDWIYINCTITDVTDVYLDWLNETIWTNGTYTLSNTGDDYWDINTSSVITTYEGFNYSFNINATGVGGTTIYRWNRTGRNGVSVRRYIQLNCSTVNISYTPYYWWEPIVKPTSNDVNKHDRMDFDQGNNDTVGDTGHLLTDVPGEDIENIYCYNFFTDWFGESQCIEPFTLNNIYFHSWWGTDNDSDSKIGWSKSREFANATLENEKSLEFANNRSTIHVVGDLDEVHNQYDYYLDTGLINVSHTNFTDNDIYELSIKIVSEADNPSLISNRSFGSFVLFNVPDNTTLKGFDNDSDGLNDYEELYITYTNPFLSDTDNDGVDDYIENLTGTDPNNNTNFIPTANIQFISIENNNNGTYVYTSNPTFNWTRTDNTVQYNLQISNVSDFSSMVVNISIINQYTYPIHFSQNSTRVSFILPITHSLAIYNKYYCRIKAHLLGGV